MIIPILFSLSVFGLSSFSALRNNLLHKDDLQRVNFYSDLRLAVVSPHNYSEILFAMNTCNVDSALVGGWNKDLGNFTVYKNGDVVPSSSGVVPEYSIYLDSAKKEVSSIFFRPNKDDAPSDECYKLDISLTFPSQNDATQVDSESIETNESEFDSSEAEMSEDNSGYSIRDYKSIGTNPPVEEISHDSDYSLLDSKSTGTKDQEAESHSLKEILFQQTTSVSGDDHSHNSINSVTRHSRIIFDKDENDSYKATLSKSTSRVRVSSSDIDEVSFELDALNRPNYLYELLRNAEKKFGRDILLLVGRGSRIFIGVSNKIYEVNDNTAGIVYNLLDISQDMISDLELVRVEFSKVE